MQAARLLAQGRGSAHTVTMLHMRSSGGVSSRPTRGVLGVQLHGRQRRATNESGSHARTAPARVRWRAAAAARRTDWPCACPRGCMCGGRFLQTTRHTHVRTRTPYQALQARAPAPTTSAGVRGWHAHSDVKPTHTATAPSKPRAAQAPRARVKLYSCTRSTGTLHTSRRSCSGTNQPHGIAQHDRAT